MDELPNEILPSLTGYLSPLDATRLNNTCKKLHSKVSLTATAPRQILTKFFRRDPDDDAHYGFEIPVPRGVACHSALLSLTWRDQGWGDHKGKLYLVAEHKHDGSCRPSFGGRVVHVSDAAPHEERRLDIAFQPKSHETYHLSYVVGGGGGHDLCLSDVKVQALVYDNRSRCFGNAHNFLTKMNALPAWDARRKILGVLGLDVEQMYLTHGKFAVPPLVSFAHGNNNSKSNMQHELMEFMELMGFLRSLCDSWIDECSIYAERNDAQAQMQSEFKALDDQISDCTFDEDLLEDTDVSLTDDDSFMFDLENDDIPYCADSPMDDTPGNMII